MNRFRLSPLVFFSGLALSLVCGCDQGGSGASMGSEPEATAMPAMKVDLPNPPSFAASDIPLKYDDGSLTIRGLRKQQAAMLGKPAKVKATLLEIYQCPVCPKGQTCKLCEQPHFFLGDKPDTKKEKALMVVDYLAPKEVAPKLTIGKQYVIDGTFSINSPTGFASSDGLLLFDQLTDDAGKVFVSPAKQLEDKAAAGEAAEAAQLKKISKKK